MEYTCIIDSIGYWTLFFWGGGGSFKAYLKNSVTLQCLRKKNNKNEKFKQKLSFIILHTVHVHKSSLHSAIFLILQKKVYKYENFPVNQSDSAANSIHLCQPNCTYGRHNLSIILVQKEKNVFFNNPYAAGGYFCQYSDTKTLKNERNRDL